MASALNQFSATPDDPRFQSLKQKTGAEDDIILAALDMQNEEDAMPRNLDYSRERGLRQAMSAAPVELVSGGESAQGFSDLRRVSQSDIGMDDVFAEMERATKKPSKQGESPVAAPVQDAGDFSDMSDVFAAMDRGTKPAKKQRGTLTEVGRQLVGGLASSAPKMINQAGQAFSPEGSAAETMFKENADYWANQEQGWKPDMEGRGRVAKGFIEAAGQIGPSVAAMGLTMANPAVGAATTATLFGGSQFTETWEKAQPLVKQGKMSKDDAFMAALKTGGIEGFGETVADLLGAKFLKGGATIIRNAFGAKGVEAAAQLARDPRWAGRLLAGGAANAGVQSGTEFGQGYGEALVERDAGISQDDPMQAGLHGAEVAGYMSVLMLPLGLPGSVRAARQREAAGKVMDDPQAPPEIRQRAADLMRNEMVQNSGVSKQDADAWRTQQLSPRAELETILASDKPVAEILAAQAPAAAPAQATPQAPLQPAAFGWPDIKTPAVATLPDGQIITGQIAGIQDSDGQPMARFVGADGQVWMIQPGEADIKPAPAGDGTRTAPVQADEALLAEIQSAADTQKAGEAYAAEREKAVAAIGENQVSAIEDQVADQNSGQPTIELYRAIATALKAEAARQAPQPAVQPAAQVIAAVPRSAPAVEPAKPKTPSNAAITYTRANLKIEEDGGIIITKGEEVTITHAKAEKMLAEKMNLRDRLLRFVECVHG